MQIRERHGRVECLRAYYDPAAKRTRQRLVAEADLTDAEREQLAAWRTAKQKQSDASACELAARYAQHTIERIARGIEAGHLPADEAAFWSAFGHLRRAMRKAGMQRPRRDAEPSNAGTPALFDEYDDDPIEPATVEVTPPFDEYDDDPVEPATVEPTPPFDEYDDEEGGNA